MKKPSVRVTSSHGTFNVYHWSKWICSRTTFAEAQAKADELAKKVASEKFWREELRHRKNPKPVKPRDPNAPDRVWLTHHHKDGRTTKGWYWVKPGHPFHWTASLRQERRYVDGNVDAPVTKIIPPSLPPLPFPGEAVRCKNQESNYPQPTEEEPCATTESNTNGQPTAKLNPPIPSGADAPTPPPAAPSNAPTGTSPSAAAVNVNGWASYRRLAARAKDNTAGSPRN